jgi:hypothetical protein
VPVREASGKDSTLLVLVARLRASWSTLLNKVTVRTRDGVLTTDAAATEYVAAVFTTMLPLAIDDARLSTSATV